MLIVAKFDYSRGQTANIQWPELRQVETEWTDAASLHSGSGGQNVAEVSEVDACRRQSWLQLAGGKICFYADLHPDTKIVDVV